MLSIDEASPHAVPLSRALLSNFVVNVASSLIHVEIVHVGRRYSVAFFSRSYLESWRRFEMVEARGLQRREEKGEKECRNNGRGEGGEARPFTG